MTTETITTTDERQNGNDKPNCYAKVRHGFGKKATYERIGAAWQTEDGSIYVKLAGTQVVEQGLTLYEVEDKTRREHSSRRKATDRKRARRRPPVGAAFFIASLMAQVPSESCPRRRSAGPDAWPTH